MIVFNQIFVHLAVGFEEIEAVTIIDVLRRGGLNVCVISVTGNLKVKGSHEIEICADQLFENVDYSQCDMIVLPGGMPGSKNLYEHEGLRSKILEFGKNGKFIAAICAAPFILGRLGVLQGRKVVCYPGYESQLTGAIIQDSSVFIDDRIITGKGVGAALEFSLEIVKIAANHEKALQLRKLMVID